MAGIQRFEDIEAWKEARNLTPEIYRSSSRGGFRKDFGLRDQLQRASVSVMANIAEGFDGGSNREFLKFLRYAVRSTRRFSRTCTLPWIRDTSTRKRSLRFTGLPSGSRILPVALCCTCVLGREHRTLHIEP